MADTVIARLPPPGQTATSDLVPFGLELIDAETGGLIREKLYLLYGPPPAWKTTLGLYFIFESLRSDQRAVYVTSQDPEAILLQADRLGLNLRPALYDGRLTLLSYQLRISQQLALLHDYQLVMNELRMLAGKQAPDRIVFDPIEVLVSQENKSQVLPFTRQLIEALKGLNATILCLLDETEEAHLQGMLKELLFQSYGAFQISIEHDDTRVLRFRKAVWNPREYPRIPITLRGRQGVQVLEALGRVRTTEELRRLTLAPSQDEGAEPVQLPRTFQLLLVDNDDIYHEMLQDFLTDRFKVEQVRDSVEAISRLLEHTYDVILVNMNMPRVDGREICLRIRQHQGNVPLIAFSNSLKRGADIANVLRIGADTFISRPFAFNQVKATIEAVLRRQAGPVSYNKSRELIKEILEEERVLRSLPRLDPASGLDARDYFEQKVRKEIDKARIGDYSFALVGYQFSVATGSAGDGIELDRVVSEIFRPLLRNTDLVCRVAPGSYLVYLEECLTPGVKRFNDRLRKALQQSVGPQRVSFLYDIATFPGDARGYEELIALALKSQRTAGPALKRIP